MNLTAQQTQIISDIASGTGNTIVDARAGTSKTTVIVEGARKARNSIAAVAFNASIKKELKERMPESAYVNSFHGFGYGGWFKRVQAGVKLNLDPKKRFKIADKLGLSRDEFPDFPAALSMCKSYGLVPRGAPGGRGGLMPDEPASYQQILAEYAYDCGISSDPVGILRAGLILSIQMAWAGEIDFDDQVYMSTIYHAELPCADTVLVDEAQDVNPIQSAMIDQIAQRSGRLIAVGDPYQSIYAFRGATIDSMPTLKAKYEAQQLPLTTSFRCAQAIIREAQTYVPDIEAWSERPEGSVEWASPWDQSSLPRGSAILCRNNAPLVGLCFKLISRGVGAVIVGRDIEKGLLALAKKCKAGSKEAFLARLSEHESRESARLSESQRATLADKCLALRIIANTGEPIEGTVRLLFRDRRNPPLILSTIHKSKGLEWPTVGILDPHLMPSKWAQTAEEIQQERNIAYVAITRARERLIYINSEDFK